MTTLKNSRRRIIPVRVARSDFGVSHRLPYPNLAVVWWIRPQQKSADVTRKKIRYSKWTEDAWNYRSTVTFCVEIYGACRISNSYIQGAACGLLDSTNIETCRGTTAENNAHLRCFWTFVTVGGKDPHSKNVYYRQSHLATHEFARPLSPAAVQIHGFTGNEQIQQELPNA